MIWRNNNVALALRRDGGFTMIEILVVLVILGLSLGIVAGFLPRENAALSLSSGSEQVASMLRLARLRAITAQQPVVFSGSRDGHGFLLDREAHRLPGQVTLSLTDVPAIRFVPDGSCSGGTIRLAAGSHIRILRVDWLTGRVSASDQS